MDKLVYFFVLCYLCFSGAAAKPATHGALQMFTSINGSSQQITDGKMDVAFKECGYIICNVSDIFTNQSTHLWDYYVDWELPSGSQENESMFVLANRFQLPRAYLVFTGFTTDFVGEYKCVLNFRREPIASLSLAINMSDGPASHSCSNATP